MRGNNPFKIYQYAGPDLFCDRERELSVLLESYHNQRHLLLISMRRLGKTGLIHHFQHFVSKKAKTITVYLDIQNTASDKDLVTKLISSTVFAIEKTKKGIIRRIGTFFANIKPTITFDPITQMPVLEIQIENRQQVQTSLDILLKMIGEMNKNFQISIDEFQQIANYPGGTIVDATIRGLLHKIPNVHFLFSGSQRHLLMQLFTNPKSPFFSSIDQLPLQPLDPQVYSDFIKKLFKEGKQTIDDQNIASIMSWTRGHTYHTQYFCNRLFAKRHTTITPFHVEETKREILYTFEQNYLQIKNITSKSQWKLLQAVSHREPVVNFTSRDFLAHANMAQSTVHQALNALLRKEVLYEQRSTSGNQVIIYDPFFTQWLKTTSRYSY